MDLKSDYKDDKKLAVFAQAEKLAKATKQKVVIIQSRSGYRVSLRALHKSEAKYEMFVSGDKIQVRNSINATIDEYSIKKKETKAKNITITKEVESSENKEAEQTDTPIS